MTLHPQSVEPIPALTKEIALMALSKDNLYMMMRDRLETFYNDWDFADLFPRMGQPATSPWRLALITVMQFVEGLTDRQAANAVASRIDWKYALSLELTDKSFDFSVLSEFRTRLIKGGAERQLFDLMLSSFEKAGLLKAPYSQRTDSTHVLAKIRNLSRLESLGETLRSALNSIAVVAPQWLQEIVPESWYKRYARKFEESRLPMSETKRTELAATIGRDGFYLLDILWSSEALNWLRQIHAVEILRQVWLQQYYAPTPFPVDGQWQSKAGKGYGIANFEVNWKKKLVRCPKGKVSRKWIPTHNSYQQPIISVKFNKADCLACKSRADCTRAKAGARTVTLRPQAQHEAIASAREKQQTPEFKEQYNLRAGVEGTISQGTRTFGLRRCRYRGEAKTRLQNIVTAAAINLVRVWDWWCGSSSWGTVPSRFAALAPE